MPFSVSSKPTNEELSEAVNYLLSNFSQTMAINPNTGTISTASYGIVSYLYKFLQIRYADSFNGQVNFSNSPTNRLYYGIRNDDSGVESLNSADYLWLPVTGGFGTTKFVWYATTGGRQIELFIGSIPPSVNFFQDNGSAIDLDLLTVAAENITTPSVIDYSFEIQALEQAIGSIPQPQLGTMASQNSESYVPYTGAISPVDLNAKSLTNISHLGVNTTTVPTILARFVGDNNSSSRIAVRGYSSNANSSSVRVTKFRGTFAAPQAPQNGDSLGKFELAGYGTTSSEGYAQVTFEGVATENWGAIARGAKALIKITPNGTTTEVTAITVDQNKSVTLTGSLSLPAPVTKTADFTVASNEVWLINNKSGSTCIVTLPTASAWAGRSINIKNMQAQLVNSASSNVVPLDSTTAGTAILLDVVGNWATMVSDGTNWVIMQAASNNNLLLE
jgi:hypothetical protein